MRPTIPIVNPMMQPCDVLKLIARIRSLISPGTVDSSVNIMIRLGVDDDTHAQKMNGNGSVFQCDCAMRLPFWEPCKQTMHTLIWIL